MAGIYVYSCASGDAADCHGHVPPAEPRARYLTTGIHLDQLIRTAGKCDRSIRKGKGISRGIRKLQENLLGDVAIAQRHDLWRRRHRDRTTRIRRVARSEEHTSELQ